MVFRFARFVRVPEQKQKRLKLTVSRVRPARAVVHKCKLHRLPTHLSHQSISVYLTFSSRKPGIKTKKLKNQVFYTR